MKLPRPSLSSIATVVASMAVFAAGGHFVANAIIEGQQLQRLNELTEIALRRSEVAVDFASASIAEIAKSGHVGCDPSSLQVFRLHVYQLPTVKDVRLARSDGAVICSAYSETLEFDKDWVRRPDMLPSRDDKLRLFRVEQFGGAPSPCRTPASRNRPSTRSSRHG